METKRILSSAVLVAFLAGIIASCDTTSTNTKPEKGNVELQFETVTSTSSAKTASTGNTITANDSLIVEGTNGSLQIDDIHFIVEKFKLEPEDIEADDDSADTEIEEFEAEPFFVDLPLNEDVLSLANNEIEAGLYEEFEFEIKDLDFEDEDKEEGEDEGDIEDQALADTIRSHFPDWPDEASMVLTGTFTPADGDPRPFKIFAKAEIEVEMEFEPPLEVTEDNLQQVVSVRINPARWLEEADGTVVDLSQYDWDQEQQLLEFSAKFKDGLEEIEVEDQDFDDDDEDDDDD